MWSRFCRGHRRACGGLTGQAAIPARDGDGVSGHMDPGDGGARKGVAAMRRSAGHLAPPGLAEPGTHARIRIAGLPPGSRP